jgi:hypothetical protein
VEASNKRKHIEWKQAIKDMQQHIEWKQAIKENILSGSKQ